ncbi:MAG: SHOCT domain-containing protein [Pseudomonadota bacterium]
MFEHGYGMGFGGGFMWLFWIILIVVIVILVRSASGSSGEKRVRTALEILEERYARGEIEKEEFEQKRRDLIH